MGLLSKEAQEEEEEDEDEEQPGAGKQEREQEEEDGGEEGRSPEGHLPKPAPAPPELGMEMVKKGAPSGLPGEREVRV